MVNDMIFRYKLMSFAANQNQCLKQIDNLKHQKPPANICNLKTAAICGENKKLGESNYVQS